MNPLSSSKKVLVLDGDMVPCLAIVRSLSRMGIHADIASHLAQTITGYSRFTHQTLTYPDPLANESDFLAWCETILLTQPYELVIPVTERTVVPLQTLLDQPIGKKLAIAPAAALSVALDKDKTLELAQQLGLPVPKSVLVISLQDVIDHCSALVMPVVLKPARSIGADVQSRKQLSVDYAFSPRELETKVQHFLRYGPVLIQEYVGGKGVGIELIANHGEVAFAFQHLRLHEVPLTGGGSSLRMSVSIEPELLEASQKLMRALKWHGVAMVEFKWNPSNRTYSLMEINGRFWGSLPLAVAAGADFPAMLYEMLTTGHIQQRPPAKTGVYCRKLSSDLYWHELVLRREGPPALVRFPTPSSIAKDALRVFSFSHHFDVQSWRDPLPGLIDLRNIIMDNLKRITGKLAERKAHKRQRRAWNTGEVQRKLKSARQILFVCYGNINRSALAERYFLHQFPSSGLKALSAGFHQEDGRPADPVMVEVAAEANINMNDWSSRQLTSQLLTDSDLIFVMELSHIHRIQKDYPHCSSKTYLLNAGPLIGQSTEIADPYGKERIVYQRVCTQIMGSVDYATHSLLTSSRSASKSVN